MRRLLVLTDVGEEIDDEGALWMMCRVLDGAPTWEADVVFVTGRPLERASRWATILNSVSGPKPAAGRTRYFVGPETARCLRYPQVVDAAFLAQEGVAPLTPFVGGAYDVVLQISPIGGFTAPEQDPEGPLARVTRRPGTEAALYIVVGREGSTNFPIAEPVHRSFKRALLAQGFAAVHVEAANYAAWSGDDLDLLPGALAELVADDEWNKAVGRISPHAADLFVRFRVTTQVNYNVVSRAYAVVKSRHGDETAFRQTSAWWAKIADLARKTIAERYVAASRENDDAGARYGDVSLRDLVRGQESTWGSLMSPECRKDILANFGPEILDSTGAKGEELSEDVLAACRVDAVLGWAVLLTTEQIARMYAYVVFRAGELPDAESFQEYLTGSPPLSFRRFPAFPAASAPWATLIKKEVIRNPQYDPSGMLVALVAMQADPSEVGLLVQKLKVHQSLLPPDQRAAAVRAAYRGEAPDLLLARFFPGRAGTPADGEDSCSAGRPPAPPSSDG